MKLEKKETQKNILKNTYIMESKYISRKNNNLA